MPFTAFTLVVRRSAFPLLNLRGKTFYSTKISKPLRILFCGSDHFSSASLRALRAEQLWDPKSISSIDVLCRPGKRAGRNLKKIRDVPIKAVAQELGLPIHERDTFTGWELPKSYNEPINLIIAVSFGLFVPPRILKSVEYGGLNVHPSLLPQFRGPAPLHHTINSGSKYTGVTLQTLDEKTFDHGVILAQTPHPGLEIPSPDQCTYADLLEFITPKAAEILIRGIRERLFVPPQVAVASSAKKSGRIIQYAPKVTPEDRQIYWNISTCSEIERRYRAFGRLWSQVNPNPVTSMRFVFEDFKVVLLAEVVGEEIEKPWMAFNVNGDSAHDGSPLMWKYFEDGGAIVIVTEVNDGMALRVKEITIEGQRKQSARQAMQFLQRIV